MRVAHCKLCLFFGGVGSHWEQRQFPLLMGAQYVEHFHVDQFNGVAHILQSSYLLLILFQPVVDFLLELIVFHEVIKVGVQNGSQLLKGDSGDGRGKAIELSHCQVKRTQSNRLLVRECQRLVSHSSIQGVHQEGVALLVLLAPLQLQLWLKVEVLLEEQLPPPRPKQLLPPPQQPFQTHLSLLPSSLFLGLLQFYSHLYCEGVESLVVGDVVELTIYQQENPPVHHTSQSILPPYLLHHLPHVLVPRQSDVDVLLANSHQIQPEGLGSVQRIVLRLKQGIVYATHPSLQQHQALLHASHQRLVLQLVQFLHQLEDICAAQLLSDHNLTCLL